MMRRLAYAHRRASAHLVRKGTELSHGPISGDLKHTRRTRMGPICSENAGPTPIGWSLLSLQLEPQPRALTDIAERVPRMPTLMF